MGKKRADQRQGVLFINTKEFFGSVMNVHFQIVKHLDPQCFRVFVANNRRGNCGPYFRGLAHVVTLDYDLGVTPRGSRTLWALALRLIRNLWVPLSTLSLLFLVRREGIQIIHISSDARMMVLGLLLSILGGAKLVVHVHGDPNAYGVMRKSLVRMVRLLRQYAVITVSSFIRQKVLEMGFHQGRVWPVLNVVDLNRFHPAIDGQQVRQEYGIEPEVPLIGMVGRISPEKGQRYLLKALPRVRQAFPRVKALLVGWDDPTRRTNGMSCRQELEALCAREGLQESVIFAPPRPDVEKVYAACDVIVVPSIGDPCPLVVLEAMAMGRAIVAFKSGGIPELVHHEKTGLLVSPGSSWELAQALIRLLEDPMLLERLGRQARRRVQKHFYEARLARDVEKVYQSLLGPPSPVLEVAVDGD